MKFNQRIGRRAFLQGAAALGATWGTTTGIPILAAEGQQRVPASDRITLGHIGIGGNGAGHLQAFLNMDDVQVLAVCDVDQARRDVAKKFVETRYGKVARSGNSSLHSRG